MLGFAARRLLVSIPVLALLTLVVFVGISAVGDPLGSLRARPGVSEQTLEQIVERRHLDRPLLVQYGHWVRELAGGGFGTTVGGRAIWPDLRRALGNTLQLVLVAEILAISVGVLLGALAARRPHGVVDRLVTVGTVIGYSLPVFWVALMLQVLATNLFEATGRRVFYTAGLRSLDAGSGLALLVDRAQHLALPVLTLAIVSIALYSRYMRAGLLDVFDAQFVRAARGKGLGEPVVLRRHALRTALLPVVTVAAVNAGQILGSAIVVETVFSIDGVGRYFLQALLARETHAVMAVLLVTGVLVVVANLVADLGYAALDPRVRQGAQPRARPETR